MPESSQSLDSLFRDMRRAVYAADRTEDAAALRTRTVAAMQRLQSRSGRRAEGRRFLRPLLLAAAALLVPALAIAAWSYLGKIEGSSRLAPAPTLYSMQGVLDVRSPDGPLDAPLTLPRAIAEEEQLRIGPRSSARFQLPSGADIAASASTELSLHRDVDHQSERVELRSGRIDVVVPKLEGKRSFFVRTPDALVSVHGTEFSVDVRSGPKGPTSTSVHVRSGIVSVESKGSVTRLLAGARWASQPAVSEDGEREAPPGSRPAATVPAADDSLPAESPERAAPRANPAAHAAAVGTPRRGTPPGARRAAERSENEPPLARDPEPPASTLGEENALLTRAMAARRAGEAGRALALLSQLVGQYPRSPLRQNALVERFRVLSLQGSPEASAAARRYLAEYPKGMAREEARRVAAQTAPGEERN